MYSFKDDIASRLPDGYTLSRMYSHSKDASTIEAYKDGTRTAFSLEKVDVTPLFIKLPTIYVTSSETYNDVFAKISDLFGLGLLKDIDYYNSKAVNPSSVPQYLELELSDDSYGYKGKIRCYAILDAFNGIVAGQDRDLTQADLADELDKLKFRNYLMGNLFTIPTPIVVAGTLSLTFINEVLKNVDTEVREGCEAILRKFLSGSTVLDSYSDGLSDIVLILSSNHELFQIRYQGTLSIIKNNDEDDTKTDDSQELPVGSGEGSAENPVGGEGDLNTGEQSEHPNSSTEGSDELEIEIE